MSRRRKKRKQPVVGSVVRVWFLVLSGVGILLASPFIIGVILIAALVVIAREVSRGRQQHQKPSPVRKGRVSTDPRQYE